MGDVMRDLDGKHLITGDFIVVSGDVISNLPIEKMLAKHRARRQTDKNAIMTLILREAGAKHRTKASSTSPVFVIDPTKDRCLHYEEIRSKREAPGAPSHLTMDPELLTSHAEIDIRQDLIDCNIDICTPEVLGLWSDSFDYQAPRKQFLHGVLKDYELNGKTIHTDIVKEHYAARVRNLKAYDAVTKDTISRWTYPLCPETNLLPGHSYSLKRGNIYQEQGVMLARSCVINPRSVIGQETSIGDGTVVTNSVLGRRCQIGKDVVLEGAYLWDGAVVGDGTEIRQAIVANGASVGNGCKVEPGVLLSYGVKIANGMTVGRSTRITLAQRPEHKHVPNDPKIVGEGGEGYEFFELEEEDDGSDEGSVASSGLGMYCTCACAPFIYEYLLTNLVYNMQELSLSNESISTLSSELSEDEEGYFDRSRSNSFGTSMSDDEGAAGGQFHQDAVSNIYDGLRDGLSADVVQLELVGLRMSANASEHQVRQAVVEAFMKRIQQIIDEDSASAGEAVKQIFGKYKEIVERIVFDRDLDDKPDQVDLLLLIQKDVLGKSKGETLLLFTSKELYDLELVDEEAFEQWWEDERSSNTEEMKNARSQTEQFVEWLANAEEDDSDDSDDDEDDD